MRGALPICWLLFKVANSCGSSGCFDIIPKIGFLRKVKIWNGWKYIHPCMIQEMVEREWCEDITLIRLMRRWHYANKMVFWGLESCCLFLAKTQWSSLYNVHNTFRLFHLQVHDQRCGCEGSRPRGDCPKKIILFWCILSLHGYIAFFSMAGALAVVTATSISENIFIYSMF